MRRYRTIEQGSLSPRDDRDPGLPIRKNSRGRIRRAHNLVEWWIDDKPFAESTEDNGRSLWPPSRGRHVAKARVWESEADDPTWTKPVGFRVK